MIGFIHIVDWHDLFSGLISPRGRVCSKISALIIVEESPAIGIRKNYRGLDRTRPDDCQQCLLDSIVDAQPAEGNAAR